MMHAAPNEVPRAPDIPPELHEAAAELGRQWAESSVRPRLSRATKEHWDALMDAWADDPGMPLAVRKTSGSARGGAVLHRDSGREIVLADNSPAQWAFASALCGREFSVEDLKAQIGSHRVPFTFATKRADKLSVKYKGTLTTCGVDLNIKGWKLCHIRPVGLRTRTPAEDLPISQLRDHFKLLLKPSNHFLIPKNWAGLGEIPEVIKAVREFEERSEA